MRQLRGKLTYANVVSTLCLFLVLGGGAYAATRLPKNSVGSRQLKNGAVTPAKLSRKAKKALAGKRGPAGKRGKAGPQGPVGVQGPEGPAPKSELVVAYGGPRAVTSGEAEFPLSGTTEWDQPAGKVGLLIAQASATLATNTEATFPEPEEECRLGVEIFDNGDRVGTAGFFFFSGTTPHAATPTEYLSEDSTSNLGLIKSGVHHLTAVYAGNGAAGCAPGSRIDQVRVAIVPVG